MPNNLERREIFREHFEECIAHLARRLNEKMPQRTKGLFEARKPIAEFCGVTDTTVARWLSETLPQRPIGDYEFKMKCLLDINGYRIIEFERLPTTLRNIAELIGFGIVAADKASEFLGYTRTSTLYVILRGEGGLSKEKESAMFKVWKERRDELERRKKEAAQRYHIAFLDPTPDNALSSLILAPSLKNGTAATKRTAVLNVLKGLLGLLDEDLFKGLSESEFDILREQHGSDILQLAARLNALGSKFIARQGD
jgi:hypothetical protein